MVKLNQFLFVCNNLNEIGMLISHSDNRPEKCLKLQERKKVGLYFS